jgi:selenocysteine-specific elongation factor
MTSGVIVGTAGHVDHGKTALVRALTGVETDRWAEEKERGLTIDIGFAALETARGLDAGIVDVPGHEDYVRNMLAGSTGIDVLLLVVAADEGPMPQTREHLTIARLLGIQAGLVALNKIDRVDEDWLQLAREATGDELVATLGHDDWPIVNVSAHSGQGLDDLHEEISRVAAGVRRRDVDDLFRMPVDRAFSVPGAGTVVTGTSWSGRVAVGDRVRLLPAGVPARVRSLQVHGEERPDAGPGLRCALALVGVDHSNTDRGDVVVSGEAWGTSKRLGVSLEVPSTSRWEVDHGQRVRLFLGTREVMARVRTLDRTPIGIGSTGWAVLDCERPVVARAGDRFVLRFYSPVVTVGGGQVCALDPPRGWRTNVADWTAVADGSVEAAIQAVLRMAAGRGVRRRDLPMHTGAPAPAIAAALGDATSAIGVGDAWYSAEVGTAAEDAVLSHLEEAHELRRRQSAVSLESVRGSLTRRYASPLIDHAIASLVSKGAVRIDGPGIRLADHQVGLSPAEEESIRSVLYALEMAGLSPPSPAELAADLGIGRELLNDLLRILLERGDIVRVSPEIYLTREAEQEARAAVRRVARDRPAGPGDFRDELDVTRKYLIPLLEHMDRTGVTRRTPEGRVARDG